MSIVGTRLSFIVIIPKKLITQTEIPLHIPPLRQDQLNTKEGQELFALCSVIASNRNFTQDSLDKLRSFVDKNYGILFPTVPSLRMLLRPISAETIAPTNEELFRQLRFFVENQQSFTKRPLAPIDYRGREKAFLMLSLRCAPPMIMMLLILIVPIWSVSSLNGVIAACILLPLTIAFCILSAIPEIKTFQRTKITVFGVKEITIGSSDDGGSSRGWEARTNLGPARIPHSKYIELLSLSDRPGFDPAVGIQIKCGITNRHAPFLPWFSTGVANIWAPINIPRKI